MHIQRIEDTAVAPTSDNRHRIGRTAEGPVVLTHLGRGLAVHPFRQVFVVVDIRLSAVRRVEALGRYVLTLLGVIVVIVAGIRAHVTPVMEKRIVMTSHPRFLRSAERLGSCQRILVVQIILLDHGVTEQDETVRRYVGKQVLDDRAPVRGHVLRLVAVVVGVVPLSPHADESRFQHIDHIRVGGQMGFQLLHMSDSPCRLGVLFVALPLGICEA